MATLQALALILLVSTNVCLARQATDVPGASEPPVAGGEPSLPDVTAIRGAVLGIGSTDSVRIALDIHLARTAADSVLFPTRGLRVDSVHVDGRPAPFVRGAYRTAVSLLADPGPPDSLETDAPATAPSAETPDEMRVTLFYVVRSGLNRRSGSGGPLAAWTAPGGLDTHWLPLPSASDDLFTADLTFVLPEDWTLVQAAGAAPPDSSDAGPAANLWLMRPVEALAARDLGFAAVRSDALRPAADTSDGSGPSIFAVGSGILDRPADSVRADLQRTTDFLSGSLSLSVTRSGSVHLLIGGSPGGAVGPGVFIHGDRYPAADDPWMTDFANVRSIADAVLAPFMTRIPSTDLWLREAIVTWLSAHQVRTMHGEAAFGDIMERLRVDYLHQAADHQRPLVWDRWHEPADLLDLHARSRGAWTLHMLDSIVGREALLSGLDAFLDMPDDRLRDSEALREAIEDYSNEDLSRFFDAWVYGAGHPVLGITSSHDAAGERLFLRIEQQQDGELVPAAFPMHPDLRFASIEGVTEQTVIVDEPITEVSFPASIAPNYLHVDTRAAWLFEVAPPPSADDLVSMLRDDDSPASRIRLYRTVARDASDSGLLFGARRVIESETDPVAKAIGLSLPAAMAPAASAERMLLDHVNDPSAVVRAHVLRGLSAFESTVVGETALRAANSDTDPLVLSAAVPVLIDRRPAIAWDVIESALVTASPQHRVRLTALRMIQGVEHTDSERVATLLDHTGAGQPYAIRRTAALEAAAAFPGNTRVGRLLVSWLTAEEALLRLTALDMLVVMPSDRASELRAAAFDSAENAHPAPDPDPLVRTRLDRMSAPGESG